MGSLSPGTLPARRFLPVILALGKDLSSKGFLTLVGRFRQRGRTPPKLLLLVNNARCRAQRNLELMWLVGCLTPDFNTIAYFRKDNPKGILGVCRQFVVLCRELELLIEAVVVIDGRKFRQSITATATSPAPSCNGSWRPRCEYRRAIGQLGTSARSTSPGPSVRGLPTARPTG